MAISNEQIERLIKALESNGGKSNPFRQKTTSVGEKEIITSEDLKKLFGELTRGQNSFRDFKNSFKEVREERERLNKVVEEGIEKEKIYKKLIEDIPENVKKHFNDVKVYEELKRQLQEIEETINALSETDTTAYQNLIDKASEFEKKMKAIREGMEADGTSIEETTKYLEAESEAAHDVYNNRKEQVNIEGHIKAAHKGQVSYLREGLQKVKETFNAVKSLASEWGKIDQAAANYAKSVGMSQAGYKAVTSRAIGVVNSRQLGINYNMSADELLKTQQGISSQIGRNIGWNADGQENIAAMTAVMGDSASEMMVKLENFGLSVNDSAKKSGEMFKTASEYGISFEKYSKNFLDNITIAQNYTFKNGIKGLESMAKKATAIRLDMKAVAGFAEQVQTLEGAMNASAQLQVLGGSFAAFSDPLSMMNEGLNDMEGLFDRVSGMIQGMGTFNKATGEVEVSAFNKRKINAAAKAMGMSPDQLMESVNRQAAAGEIERQLNVSGRGDLSDKMKELVKNNGVFQNGKAGVNINGKFVGVDQLNNKMEEELIKETQSEAEDIKDIARNLRGFMDMQDGFNKQLSNMTASIFGWLGEAFKGLTGALGSAGLLMGGIALFKGVGSIASPWLAGKGGDIFGKGLDLFGKGGGKIGQFGRIANGNGLGKLKALRNAGNVASSGAGVLSKIGSIGHMGGPFSAAGAGAGLSVIGGVAAGAAGLYYGIKGGKKRKERIANGEGRRGDKEDRSLTKKMGAGYGAAAGAAIGSFIPGLGTLLGAGVGALAGYGIGALNASKRKAQGKAENGEIDLLDTIDKRGDKIAKGKVNKDNAINGGFIKEASFHVMTAHFNLEGIKIDPVSLKGSGNERVSKRGGKSAGLGSSDENTFNLNVNGTIKLDTGTQRIDVTKEFVEKIVAELVRNNPSLRSLGDALVKHSPDIQDLKEA